MKSNDLFCPCHLLSASTRKGNLLDYGTGTGYHGEVHFRVDIRQPFTLDPMAFHPLLTVTSFSTSKGIHFWAISGPNNAKTVNTPVNCPARYYYTRNTATTLQSRMKEWPAAHNLRSKHLTPGLRHLQEHQLGDESLPDSELITFPPCVCALWLQVMTIAPCSCVWPKSEQKAKLGWQCKVLVAFFIGYTRI